MKTTLNKIRECDPCEDSWRKLLKSLGKTEADDEDLSILTILESNGLDDALWALRAVKGYDREIRLLACDYAEHVLHIFEEACHNDKRPRNAIEVSKRYANGEATREELDAARSDAWDAAWYAAADAASRAAWDAAWAALEADSRVARAAARDAARDATAERKWQEQKLRELLSSL